MFLFSAYYDVLTSLKSLSSWGETTSPGDSQLLKTAKGTAKNLPLRCNLSTPEPYLLYLVSAGGNILLPNHSRARYHTNSDQIYCLKPNGIIQTRQS